MREDLPPNHRLSVLIHELAHALLPPDRGLAPEVEEVVGESVAYVACQSAGLDTAQSAACYLASWGEEGALETAKQAAGLIDELARRIEAIAEPKEDESQTGP